MIVTAWNNGSQGYGIKVSLADRAEYFSRRWKEVCVKIGDKPEDTFNLPPSFWRTCRGIFDTAFRDWFEEMGHLKWPYRDPPKFRLTPMGGNLFHLTE